MGTEKYWAWEGQGSALPKADLVGQSMKSLLAVLISARWREYSDLQTLGEAPDSSPSSHLRTKDRQ